MSTGKDLYEARRQTELLEAQNRLIRARQEAAGLAFFDLAMVTLTAFFKGDAYLTVEKGPSGETFVAFRMPSSPKAK